MSFIKTWIFIYGWKNSLMNNMRALINLITAVTCIAFFPNASLADKHSQSRGHTWQLLSAEQQRLLAGHEKDWDKLPPQRQQQLQHAADQWASMPPQERSLAQRRYHTFLSLPAKTRREILKGYKRIQEYNPTLQESLRKTYRNFQSFPEYEKRVRRDRWRILYRTQASTAVDGSTAQSPDIN